jgi:membrane associated rhomboid family serine protease
LLVAANIVAAYVLLVHPGAALEYGFDPGRPHAVDAVANLFFHQNIMHLLGNMVFLAAVGPAVEAAAGWARFVAVYVLGGLTGVAAFWFFARQAQDPAPLIGASGCVAACIAYYNTRYSRLQVVLAPHVGVPIVAITVVWLALQVLGAFVTLGGAAGGQAFWAHLGGFLAGLLMSVLFRAPKDADRHLGHVTMDRLEERSLAAKIRASDIHLAKHPEDIAALKKKAEALALLGDKPHEAQVLVALLDVAPESDHPELLARLVGIGQISLLSSLRRTLLAEKFRCDYPELARSLLLSVVGGDPADSQRPDALLALALLSEEAERSKWLDELAERFALHPAAELARKRGLL